MAQKKINKTVKISQSQEIEVLHKIVDLASEDMDLTQTLMEIIKVVNGFTKADSVFIYLYEKRNKELRLMASKTSHDRELGNIKIRNGEGITGWVAEQNKVVAISENAYADKRFKGFDVLPEDKYEALLSVPIIYKEKVSGVINVQHKNRTFMQRKPSH